MKFYLISALLMIVIMNIHDSFALVIWGGEQVKGDIFNWVVKITGTLTERDRTTGITLDYIVHCTGSIISELHILTAAHCLEEISPANITVIAGAIYLNSPSRSEHRVKKIDKHPSYGLSTVGIQQHSGNSYQLKLNDIGILTLETRLLFGESITAIPLPIEELILSSQSIPCKIAAWGTGSSGLETVNLLWTTVNLQRFTQYQQCLSRHKLICGRNRQLATYTTSGDSGAGLWCNGVLTGVLFGSADRVEDPTIFQNVYQFLPFINSVLRRDAELLNSIHSSPKAKKFRPCICL